MPDSELRHVASLSAMMRQKEKELRSLSKRRQEECRRLVAGSPAYQGVTYRRLAEAMGISEVAVYKILRGTGPGLREAELQRREKPVVQKIRKPLGDA